MTLRHLLLLVSLALPAIAIAVEAPKSPSLRIETGRHTAVINSIATDSAGRWLVTASDDKSLRVWELPAVRGVRTIRPPSGEGHEGKLFSVALSPDSETIASGGWTTLDSNGGDAIFLFNRASGALTARITGLPNVIRHLAFSPDGRYLVASLGGKGGVRFYRTVDWTSSGVDREYAAQSNSAHFSHDGRLVTTSYDGFIRLYDTTDGTLRLVARIRAPGGSQPLTACFSPDGTVVAVGYSDTTNVSVLSGRDLSLLYSPDTKGVPKGNLGIVAWSADGRTLFAGGKYLKNFNGVWQSHIRYWDDSGRGGYRDVAASGNGITITELTPLPDGGIVFASSDSAFGLLDRNGKRTISVPPVSPDYRNNLAGFLAAKDGTRIGFGYEVFGNFPATFNLTTRNLAPGRATATLSPPAIKAPGLTIDGWMGTSEPKLNGIRLALSQREISRSLAIAPDGKSFVLGTDWYLRRIDSSGRELWKVPASGAAWAVNIASNGAVALAAYADGTIRWHRLSDGKELLAFFPHADRKRWVLWTPGGYYDVSPGGEELIGWHVDNGKDRAADFFPAAEFHATFYRPDVIGKVLGTLDAGEALRLADAERDR